MPHCLLHNNSLENQLVFQIQLPKRDHQYNKLDLNLVEQ